MTQIITTSGGIVFAEAEDEFIYIAEGVTRAADAPALNSVGWGGTLVHVLGNVAGGFGIYLYDERSDTGEFRVTVGAGGSVIGHNTGIYFLDDPNSKVANHGEITGYGLFGIHSGGAEFQLTNTGLITSYGTQSAVYSSGAGSDIVNYGLIQSLGSGPFAHAVDLRDSGAGEVVTLTNFGTLSAASGIAVEGDADGIDRIRNFGLIDGDVLQFGGGDVFRNGGQVLGDVDLGTGNDLFRGAGGTVEGDIVGGTGNDTIHGGISDDALSGASGNDVLRGGIGEDTITGGTGIDVMAGGADADTFDFNATAESGVVAANRDVILDFQKGFDLIDLSTIDANAAIAGDQAFAFIGTSPFSATGQVRVVQQGGSTVVLVSNDADTAAEMAFTLSGLLPPTAADFVL